MHSSKRKASEVIHIDEAASLVEITPLGAGQEVGRSCIIVKYEGKGVMLDCGIHPGHSGLNSLPYLDGDEDVDISKLQVALITHFHLDHCAAVPYLLSKTRFQGRVFMTHPTKAIYHSLIKDFARSARGLADQALYTEEDVDASMSRIEVIDFMQTMEVAPGIQVTPLRAGHVLGAAMFLVEIAGCRILYTGDYSRVPDRHLPAADIPHITPHIVIVESTYGVSRHLPREQREALFLQRITDTLRGGGRVLLPVVALGRAQELLLLLDEYWASHPELHGVPIYQASGQMRKSMRVYETYVESLNEDIKRVFQHHNPFAFRHVTHLKSMQQFDDVGPCVLMATPSGLQSGASREAFEAWCDDRRNTVIIVDFAVQGTLAREILGGPKDILTKTGYRKPLRCGVVHISFSAHADYEQTSGFLDTVRPPHVVLVHGEKTEMMRLKSALEKGAAEIGVQRSMYTPAVMQTVKIVHEPLRVVRAAGRLGAKPPHEGQPLLGVMVAPPPAGGGVGTPQPLLLHPDDLPAFTKLHRGRVTQRQALATRLPWSQLRLALEVMFEGVEGAGLWPVSSSPPRSPTPTPAAGQQHQQQQQQQQQQEGATQAAHETGQQSMDVDQEPGGPAGPAQAQQAGAGVAQQQGAEGVEPAAAGDTAQPAAAAAAAAAAGGGTVQAGAHPDNTHEGGGQREGEGPREEVQEEAVCVGELVMVTHKPANPRAGYDAHVMVEWEGGKVSDMLADAVVAVLLQASAAGADSLGHGPHPTAALAHAETALQAAHAAKDEEAVLRAECDAVAALLAVQFGPSWADHKSGEVHVQAGGTGAEPGSGMHLVVSVPDGKVVCGDAALRARVSKAVSRLLHAMRPLPLAP